MKVAIKITKQTNNNKKTIRTYEGTLHVAVRRNERRKKKKKQKEANEQTKNSL